MRKKKFLCVGNKVNEDFDMKQIFNGLNREGGRISLATLCEFFIQTYENRYVGIDYDSQKKMITISMPIFER